MKARKARSFQGLKESAQAIALLQEKWPRAFPKKYSAVRPLARSVMEAIVAGTGWNKDYTMACLALGNLDWLIVMRCCETLSASMLTAT